jgi:peptidoglycan/xylan/chitin deacetylase (PgdA/CDA1 family)
LTNLLLARLHNHSVILCFHRIKNSSGTLIDRRVGTTPPDVFEKVINYLRVLGYTFISLEELGKKIEGSRLGREAVITFDDGFKDLYQNAYPFLRKSNIPFTLFLITSVVDSKKLLWLHKLYISIEKLSPMKREEVLRKYLDLPDHNVELANVVGSAFISKEKKVIEDLVINIVNEAEWSEEKEQRIAEMLYLSKAELLEMQKHGLNIEVHGHEHWPLTKLSRADTEEEIRSSANYILHALYRKPRFYCLPFGTSNQYVNDIVEDLEITGITTTEPKLITKDDTYGLPRICVLNSFAVFYRQLNRLYWKRVVRDPFNGIRTMLDERR